MEFRVFFATANCKNDYFSLKFTHAFVFPKSIFIVQGRKIDYKYVLTCTRCVKFIYCMQSLTKW